VAVIGGGFTGLAAAAWLRRLAPEKKVVLLERGQLGAGASGRTGGVALAESAAGELPGLGDVLAGLASIVRALDVHCDLALPGAWEIGRRGPRRDSPLVWEDSGTLRVVNEVPGGTVDPGSLLSGLACAAQRLGASIQEGAVVENVAFGEPLALTLPGASLRARAALFATNALSLELSGLQDRALPKFTFAVATEPLDDRRLSALGLASGKPFYTIDLPYLWGRLLTGGRIVFGSGLVHPADWREMDALDVASGEPAELLADLARRVRGLHPALADVQFTHRWGGPILFGPAWQPVFSRHPRSANALVLGAYSGHGVALSVYLGCWAAEVLLGRRELPAWGALRA
jgi:glycine/D-amino acid oxidase-like deaminating enzyme